MMLPFFTVLLAFGVLSDATEEPSCEQERPAHCFTTPGLEKVKLPDSEEAMNMMCPIVLPTYKCMVDFKNKCVNKFPKAYEEEMDIIYENLLEACEKKSKLHQKLSTHLPCIHDVLVSYRNTCKPIVNEAVEEITSELSLERNEDGDFEDSDDVEKYYCIFNALETSCLVASTSLRCGEDAKDLVLEIADRLGSFEANCSEDFYEEIKEAVALLIPLMEVQLASK